MSLQVTQGMVLAAGRGERMRPLTDHMPKPMIEVAGRSMLDRALDHLEAAGVTHIVVNTCYKAQMLEDHLQKREHPPIISREEIALETGGGIALALHHFDNKPFFVVNGDIIWMDGAIPALNALQAHWRDDIDALLLLQPVEKAIGYDGKGDFFLGVGDLRERRGNQSTAPYVFAGVQLLHPRLFRDAPQGAFSMNILYNKALASARLKALIHNGDWLHVGDVSGKEKAEHFLTEIAV